MFIRKWRFPYRISAMAFARQLPVLAMTLALLLLVTPTPGMAGHVVERIRANGYVTCGINYLPGFSGISRKGVPTGMDVDYCRALARVILDNPDAIRLLRINSRHKFQATRDGDIDVNFGLTSWSYERETVEKVAFAAPIFHDAQGFIAWADTEISNLDDVARSSICVQSTINTLTNLESWLGENHQANLVVFTTSEEKLNAFAERRCLVLTGAVVELSGYRLQNAINPDHW